MFVCVCVVACVYFHYRTLFGLDSLYIGRHMNFSDCVLNFIFFICSLVMTMEIHHYWVFGRTFDHSGSPWSLLYIYGHFRSSPIFVFALRSIFHVPFWPISAYSKFGHENIAQIYSVCVLTFRTHIFMYISFTPTPYSQLYLFISPPTNLIKKSNPWQWTAKEEACFQELKKKISSTNCLGVPRPKGEIILITDACDVGGGVPYTSSRSLTLLSCLSNMHNPSSIAHLLH